MFSLENSLVFTLFWERGGILFRREGGQVEVYQTLTNLVKIAGAYVKFIFGGKLVVVRWWLGGCAGGYHSEYSDLLWAKTVVWAQAEKSSRQEMEIFLPLACLRSKYFFYKYFSFDVQNFQNQT